MGTSAERPPRCLTCLEPAEGALPPDENRQHPLCSICNHRIRMDLAAVPLHELDPVQYGWVLFEWVEFLCAGERRSLRSFKRLVGGREFLQRDERGDGSRP